MIYNAVCSECGQYVTNSREWERHHHGQPAPVPIHSVAAEAPDREAGDGGPSVTEGSPVQSSAAADALARATRNYAQTSCAVDHRGKYGGRVECPDQPRRDAEAQIVALAAEGYELRPIGERDWKAERDALIDDYERQMFNLTRDNAALRDEVERLRDPWRKWDWPRFWEKVDYSAACWTWKGGINSNGYGSTWMDGKHEQAHRVAYEFMVGPLPDGLQIDHLCRNRACVNPAHMEPVTSRENTLRGTSVPGTNARKTRCVHGHPFDDENTLIAKDGRRQCRACHNRRSVERRERLAAARALLLNEGEA